MIYEPRRKPQVASTYIVVHIEKGDSLTYYARAATDTLVNAIEIPSSLWVRYVNALDEFEEVQAQLAEAYKRQYA